MARLGFNWQSGYFNHQRTRVRIRPWAIVMKKFLTVKCWKDEHKQIDASNIQGKRTEFFLKKWAKPDSFSLFSFFSNSILQKNCRLQRDSNSDRWNGQKYSLLFLRFTNLLFAAPRKHFLGAIKRKVKINKKLSRLNWTIVFSLFWKCVATVLCKLSV